MINIEQVKKIYSFLDARTRWQLIPLFGLMLFQSLLEMLGIGLFLPILKVLTDPNQLTEMPVIGYFYQTYSPGDPEKFFVFSAVALVVIFVIKNGAFLVNFYIQERFVLMKYAAFSERLMSTFLLRPYTFHLEKKLSRVDSYPDAVSVADISCWFVAAFAYLHGTPPRSGDSRFRTGH